MWHFYFAAITLGNVQDMKPVQNFTGCMFLDFLRQTHLGIRWKRNHIELVFLLIPSMSYISAGDSNSNFNIDSSSGLVTNSGNALSFSTNGASVTLVLLRLCHIFQLVTAIVTLILTVALDWSLPAVML